jgi:hypothetical protein
MTNTNVCFFSSPNLLAYLSRVVFKWKPTIDGEFPNGVRMHMKAMLPHFDASSYYFDMTPGESYELNRHFIDLKKSLTLR